MVGDLHIRIAKLAFHAKESPIRNVTKSSILYLHSPGVRPKVIVRPSGHPLIRDSLSEHIDVDRIHYTTHVRPFGLLCSEAMSVHARLVKST